MRLRYFLFFIIFLGGCGYHFVGEGSSLLKEIHSIAIEYLDNRTFEPGLEAIFTEAIVDEFIKSRLLDVVSKEKADAILRGTIRSFREEVISYDRDDKALEYRIHISLDLVLEKRKTGDVLWKVKNLKHTEEYPVSRNIMATEEAKDRALKKLACDLAERIHDSIIEGF